MKPQNSNAAPDSSVPTTAPAAATENGDDLLNFIRDNKLNVIWSTFDQVWIIQETGQIAHVVGRNWSIRDALDQARVALLASETPRPMEQQRSSQGLLPCPFCGGPALVRISSRMGHQVRCNVCYATTEDYTSHEAAKLAWNRRAPLISSPTQTATDARETKPTSPAPATEIG